MSMQLTRAYIGMGSNLKNPRLQVIHALEELAALPQSHGMRASSWYTSKAIGPGNQPDYTNGAVVIDTTLTPYELLDELQKIEQKHGRERHIRWGPRTLDLDLLIFGDHILNTERLTVPHPRIRERNFVAFPLVDLNPTLELPQQTIGTTLLPVINISTLASQLGSAGLTQSTTE